MNLFVTTSTTMIALLPPFPITSYILLLSYIVLHFDSKEPVSNIRTVCACVLFASAEVLPLKLMYTVTHMNGMNLTVKCVLLMQNEWLYQLIDAVIKSNVAHIDAETLNENEIDRNEFASGIVHSLVHYKCVLFHLQQFFETTICDADIDILWDII